MISVNEDDAISALLRQDFGLFLRLSFNELGGLTPYEHNWHIDAIIHQLDRVRTGDNRRLMVTMPPRHLKSRVVSVAWVAWMLGKNPALTFLCVSYGQTLAEDHAADCLKIMRSRWYVRAFPNTILTSKAVAHFRTIAGGGRMSSSVDGATTGFGADIIIVDDPMKAQDALSATIRDNVNRWFDETLSQRPNSQMTGAIIVVMQRLHEMDLVGSLQKRGGYFELCLPAIAPRDERIALTRGRSWQRIEGCALHPARQSLASLLERKTQSPYMFAGQFLQNPIPEIGNIIEAAWLREYADGELDQSQGQIVMSLDTASKDNPFNDYSAFVIARVFGKQIHLIHVERARLKFPELKAKTIELARDNGVHVLLIVDAASGQQLIQTLQAEESAGVPLPIARHPKGSKQERVMAASALIQQGRLFLPGTAHWLVDYKSELLGFPGSAHDDQVDATAQLLLWVQDKDRYRAPVNAGPIEMLDEDGDWPSEASSTPYNLDPWAA